MAIEVILPKVDMDMTTAVISQWHVKDGDPVRKGQPIFDIETDKAAMEVESPGDGTIKLASLDGAKDIAIGTVVALIYGSGEAAKAPPRPIATESAATGSVATGPTSGEPAQQPIQAPSALLETGFRAAREIRATPLAKRLARQTGVDLSGLSGTGPRGRITAADLQSAAKVAADLPAAAASANASLAPGSSSNWRSQFEAGTYVERPLEGMRRTIAQRLTLSKQSIPHFYLSATCNFNQLIAIRKRLNARAPMTDGKVPAWKLTINDFIIKALAQALQQVPDANVTFADDAILQHKHSDIGVAVAVEGGLFTPVIRRAEQKQLSVISNDMRVLAAKARARKLQPWEYQGGSAAISNLGMFGVEQFSAIINPPQASILAVGAAVERFVPEGGKPLLASQVNLTLSCDHRAVDGAAGARLLAAVRQFLEDPDLMLA